MHCDSTLLRLHLLGDQAALGEVDGGVDDVGFRRRELFDHVGVVLLAGLHLLVGGDGDARLFQRALERFRDRDGVVLGRVVGDRDRLGVQPVGQRLRGDRRDLVGHRLQGEAEAVGRVVGGQPDRHQARLDVERQGFDADARVVGADDAVEAGGDRRLRRLHSRRRVGGVVDRHDLDLLALDPALLVELARRQFRALQHSLAESRLFAGERRLETDAEVVGATVIGARAPAARRDHGETGENEGHGEPDLLLHDWRLLSRAESHLVRIRFRPGGSDDVQPAQARRP